jgi:hypothetical protein
MSLIFFWRNSLWVKALLAALTPGGRLPSLALGALVAGSLAGVLGVLGTVPLDGGGGVGVDCASVMARRVGAGALSNRILYFGASRSSIQALSKPKGFLVWSVNRVFA